MDNVGLKTIALSNIDDSPFQPRKYLDPQPLAELTESIKATGGPLVPPVVRPVGERFEIISGHRRVAACRQLGFKHVACIVKEMPDKEGQFEALTDNAQRENLSPYEITMAIMTYVGSVFGSDYENTILDIKLAAHHEQLNISGPEIKLVGKIVKTTLGCTVQHFLYTYMKLLELPEEYRDILDDGRVSLDTVRRIITIQDEGVRKQVLKRAKERGMSRREVVLYARQFSAKKKKSPEVSASPVKTEPDPDDGPRFARLLMAQRIALLQRFVDEDDDTEPSEWVEACLAIDKFLKTVGLYTPDLTRPLPFE